MAILKPAIAEFNTILLVIMLESLAIALSGIAAFAYTKIDFIREKDSIALSRIFTAVHISLGLIVIGVYIAQYSSL